MRRLLSIMTAGSALACADAPRPTNPSVEPAVGLSITPAALSIIVGDEGRLAARAFDARRTTVDAAVEWSSSNTAVAAISKTDGAVVAISVGTATVSATAGALRATAVVTVRPQDPPVGITVSSPTLSLITGGVEPLTVRTIDATGRVRVAVAEWSSSNLAVASVGKTDGIVTARAPGSAQLTATVGALHATTSVAVSEIAGSFAFTRWTPSSADNYTADVLSFSLVDRTTSAIGSSGGFASVAAPSWSPDGSQLAVEANHRFVVDASGDGADYNSDLYVLQAAAPGASPWRALTTDGLSRAPSWSPDGKRIAFLKLGALFAPNRIVVVDAAGGVPVVLTPGAGQYGRPRWSPDGKRLVFTVGTFGNGDICIANADGSGFLNLTRSAAIDADPSWSPDGTQIVFTTASTSTPAAFRFDVHVMDIDGRNVKRLTSLRNQNREPAWSPDGRQIMFVSDGVLYAMNADGSSPVRVTTPPVGAVDTGPAWKQ